MKKMQQLKWSVISFVIVAALVGGSVSGLSASSFATPAPPDVNALYVARCQKCHGADGKGVPKYQKSGQKSFADAAWQRSQTDAKILDAIAKGKGDFMPGFKGKLSAEELKALVGKVRSFKK
jgi:mono/diheme cytochrome c family protein